MAIREELETELNRLDAENVWTSPKTVTLTEDRLRLHCELTAIGSVGCSVKSISVEGEQLADSSVEQLKVKSEQLAAKLTYLLEPIAPIEIDADGCTIQLRSQPPHREPDECSYYELLVRRGGQISLQRFRAESRQTREPIDAQFTREVLGRLANDLMEAALA